MGRATSVDESSSVRSGASGGESSQTSSRRTDLKHLRHERSSATEEDEGDLLEQKRSLQDGVFQCMYTLVRQSSMKSWPFAVLKIVLEFLMFFVVAFNSDYPEWTIDQSNPVWQIVRWVVWRIPIVSVYGYTAYVRVMYALCVIVGLCLAGLVCLTLAMRRQEQSKGLHTAALVLHVAFEVVFFTCYTSFFDTFVFVANCNYTGEVKHHMCFTDVMCFDMPHLLHLVVGLVFAAIFLCVTALMVVASCDLNPASKSIMATPVAYPRLKILFAKAAFVISSADLDAYSKAKAVINCLCVALILYWNVRSVPFYRKLVTCVWCGLWLGVFYTTPILLYLVFGSDHSREHYEQSTMWVLYGIFPVVVGGTGLMALYIHWVMQPAKKFLDLQQGIKLTKVHKFASPAEVELLARVMRVYDAEGELQEDAAAHGETIIKAGMQVFPNTPYLLVLYANFQLEVRKDGPASRTQLQLASKHQPSIVDRYQIYCTGESSKRLRDSQDGGGMDLQAYIEFKRNFRAVLRVHKEVLLLQGELWTLMLKSVLKVSEVDKALDTLEVATARANQVYQRVLERYPNNGKLLRCYGHFLEDIRHDPIAASKAYAEAARHGGGDSIMSLDLSSIQGAANKPDFLTSMSMEDDAVIVANAEGQIMMTSQAAQHVFGFTKQELEGANVSMLMPQPFSQRHNAYIAHYVQGGQPRMLDSVREVVGMHKDRFVFPLSLCVTKWSGMGADSVFLAVMRPLPPNALHVRVWLAPNGTVLCGDQSFASLCGMAEGEMVGRSLASLLADMEGMAGDDAANTLLERCRGATEKELQSGSIRTYMRLKHRYLEPVPVTVTCNMAGTDDQRILVLNCLRTESTINTSILVVDTRMHVRFCAASVAALLGYSARQLASMRLEQLLPAPFNALHARWLKDPPSTVTATSCRNGRVVQLVNEAGGTVPCRLKISSCASEAAGGTSAGDTLYIAQVERVPPEEPLEEKRVVVTADFNGIITSVSRPEGELFDFPNRIMTGANLCDVIDIFRDWRERNGESQLQLLILALLDKEQEMPGTSWRVRVQAPPTAGAPSLPSVPGAQGSAGTTKGPVSKSACLQVELEDVEDDTEEGDGNSTQIRLTLWRRDLLTGAAELDEGMVVRKASPMMGLIVGLPPNSMIGRPLQRILDIPPDITWEQLADSYRKAARHRSAMKASSSSGVISPLMPILGPHPDSGTMRILLQGVQTASPRGHVRVAVVMHPDTAYVGAHADLMRVLHLDAESLLQRDKVQQGPQSPDPSVRRLATCPEDAAEGGDEAAEGEAGDGKAERSEDEGQTTLHRKAASKSEFIAQWVRTISNNTADPDAPLAPTQPSQSPQGASGSKPGSPLQHSRSRTLHTFREDGADGGGMPQPRLQGSAAEVGPLDGLLPAAAAPVQQPVLAKRNSGKAGAMPLPSQQAGGNRSDMGSRESEASKGQLAAADRQGAGAADGEDGWEKGSEGGGSSADGSQSASSLYSATETASVSEVVVDARRSKLLKGLERVLMGPTLKEPLNRLHVHGYLILAVMLLTHIICYIVATQAIRKEDVNIYRVQRQALAMDRSQLIVVRAMRGAFCERANVSKVAACADKLDITLSKLRENIELMEQHHQYVYLGDKLMPTKLIPNVHSIWTQPQYEYETFMDTEPPSVRMEHAGVWIMGSRYLAAAREALYWLPVIKDVYRLHRTFNFLITNGIGALFTGYSTSLDHLVNAAWESVDLTEQKLIICLVVEAAFIPLACLVYQWVLVQRLEAARLMGIVAMLGLPNPILRQLSSKEAKIMEEESDESDDGDSDQEEERNDRTSGTKGKGEGKASASPKGPKAGRVKRSASHRSAGEAAKDKRDSGSAPVQPAAKEGGAVDTGKTAYAEADGGGREAGVEAPSSESASSDDGASRKKSTTISQAVHAADGATRPSVGKKKSAPRAKGIPINGKVLVPSIASVANFMVPLALWNVAVVVIYVVSWSQLHGMQGPLSSLNMASHVIYRYTRLRALAFGFVIQDDLVSRGLWRGMLAKEISLFESEYQALLYGGTPITLADSVFNHPVPASTFESSAFTLEFFRHQRCFRFNQSSCFKPGDEYFEVTHHGLDVMVRRMLTEMTLLSQDDDKDVRFDGSRYNFMFYVGGQDLYEGLQQAADLFVAFSLSRYHAVTRMHLLFLLATCLLALLYVVFILWPHLARIVHDAARQSALLSHVPPEALDVRAHVRNVMRRALRGRGARARAKQHCGAEEAASTGAGAEATTGSPKEPLLLAEVAELGGS